VTGGWITQADRSRWQLLAARELAVILGDFGDLPLLAWTVVPAGPLLAARLAGPAPAGQAPAGQVRDALAAWREALGLEDYREWPGGGGTTRLHAAGRRGEVRVRIFASVFEEAR
jgi:hypothetical protein